MFQSAPRTEAFRKFPDEQQDPLHLPGYQLPLDFAPFQSNVYGVLKRSLFPTALDDRDIQKGYADQPLLTIREINMINFMETLTDIPNWWEKIDDPQTAEKWKKDALESGFDITPKMAKWIIDELRYKAMVYRLQKSVTLRNGDISKSDSAVPPALIERVRRATADLEPGPLHRVEIIPRTNGHERSLIPLGLNPLVYGKSRILPDRLLSIDDALSSIGAGEILDLPQETGITREDMVWKVASRADLKVKPYSTNFQLLPSDLQLGPDGKWHIVSYINNLHPEKFREMYEIMAEIFNELVPVWNTTLTPLKDMLHSRARIEYHKVEYRPVPQEAMNTKPQYREGESENEFAERLNNWRSEHYKAIQPDADDFRPWAVPLSMMYNLPMDLSEPVRIEEGVQLNKDYGKTGLQAFFSLLEIRLTPEDPVYERPWHIEGQLNEHICASSVLYLEGQNIEDVYLSFRQMSETASLSEVQHEIDDWVWLKQIYGLEAGSAAVQEIGRINFRPGRVIQWPSTVHTRLDPVHLKDKTKPGVLRLLATYLVDPNIRIISTANVPPQRVDWTQEMQDLGPKHYDEVKKFPPYLIDRVLNRKDGFPFLLEDAENYAKEIWLECLQFREYQSVAFTSHVLEL